MRSYLQWKATARVRAMTRSSHEFDDSELCPKFVPYFENECRIKVRYTFASGEVYERTGTVGVTSGWKPAFLLMHRSSDISSSDVLSERDEIVAVQRGRKYVKP